MKSVSSMEFVGKLFDGLLTATLYAASSLTLLLMLCISYDVVLRYFLSRPTAWANDLSGYLVYGITFIMAARVQKERGHISIDIFMSVCRPRTQAILNCVTSILCGFFCGIFAWKGFEATWVSYMHRYPLVGGIKIPEFTILWLIPFGMFLLFLQFVRLSRNCIRDFRMTITR